MVTFLAEKIKNDEGMFLRLPWDHAEILSDGLCQFLLEHEATRKTDLLSRKEFEMLDVISAALNNVIVSNDPR